jgi:CPA2 family monovalent cation:H+ antiporter-2
MVKIPTKMSAPGDEICVIGTDAQVKEFKTYLHQHEFEAPKKLKNGNYIATTGIK